MALEARRFLGRGFRFPFQFSPRTGGVFRGLAVAQTNDERHIEESIMQILGTMIGSRFMRRNFGSDMRGIVFGPNDPRLDAFLDWTIRNAIETWEPRVIVGQILIDRTEKGLGRLEVGVTFTIIKTNVVRNLVFPFYLSVDERLTFVTTSASSV